MLRSFSAASDALRVVPNCIRNRCHLTMIGKWNNHCSRIADDNDHDDLWPRRLGTPDLSRDISSN